MRVGDYLLKQTASRRFGVVPPWTVLPKVISDVKGYVNVAVPGHPDDYDSPASGGIAPGEDQAVRAAIGEALERYATRMAPLERYPALDVCESKLTLDQWSLFSEEQRASPTFPYGALYVDEALLTPARVEGDKEKTWIPYSLVSMAPDAGHLATSSGVACATSFAQAKLGALQELIERDALMMTWLHGIAPPQQAFPDHLQESVHDQGGRVWLFDITPAYSSQSVALVLGSVPFRGRMRNTIGCACRNTWSDAVDKAFLECVQGLVFLRDRLERGRWVEFSDGKRPSSFDEHAMFYTDQPALWESLPLFGTQAKSLEPVRRGESLIVPEDSAVVVSRIQSELGDSGIRLFEVDLTTIDLRQVGLRVVRMLSPDLVPVHHDHHRPYLGSATNNLALRYPQAKAPGIFPSPYPHALG